MPGIVGIVGKHAFPDGDQLFGSMLQSMMHESFYTEGRHVAKEDGWLCGSVALKGSYADGMPVRNETRDVTLLFAGECFPAARTLEALRGKGHEFKPTGADYLVHLYEEEGPDFVKNLNGWFSGVLLDEKRGKVLVFNDRCGMQRVYYYEDAHGFYFASEAKALLKVLPELRAVDPKAVAEYICFDCVLNEHSLFKNIDLLPPGALWTLERGRLDKKRYFDPRQNEGQPPFDPQSFGERLLQTFKEVLPRYLVGDKLAIAITGGLDTRLIMSCLPPGDARLTAITFGGMGRDCRDVRLGRAVSELCHIPHRTLRLDREFFSAYPREVARAIYVTDGLADATTPDTLYLDRFSRELAPIKLTGIFGSQVLGRVRRALRSRVATLECVNADFRPMVSAASSALSPYEGEHDLSFVLQREIPWYWSRFTAAQMSQLTLRSPFLDNDLVDMLYRAPAAGFDGSKFELEAIGQNRRELLNVRTNQGAGGTAPHWISSIIHRFVKLRILSEKALLWDTLPRSLHHTVTKVDTLILSPLRLNRLLIGFEYYRQYNLWFRRELVSYVKEVALDSRTLSRPYWDAKAVRRIVDAHIRGRGRYLSEIRKVLTIELIHRLLVEGRG